MQAGSVLGIVDVAAVKAADLNPDVMVLITNSDEFDEIEIGEASPVAASDVIMTLQRTIFEADESSASI